MEQKLIILITGESCTGKNYYTDVWVSVFTICTRKSLIVRAVSISNTTKREYTIATGADLNRLLWNRTYKEQYRPVLIIFFQDQI
jgi:hypothetical protein